MWTTLKSLLNLLIIMFWFFGHKAYGVLVPQSGIEPTPPALGGKVLIIGPPGKTQDYKFWMKEVEH